MKKFLRSLSTILVIIIGIPLALLFLIGYLLFIPFDVIRYHGMPYYRDHKKKYHLFITSTDIVKFYNRAVTEKLPVQYFEHEDFEYFVKDDQVLLCGWSYEGFEQVDNQWFFLLEGECNARMPMTEALENDRELLPPEHRKLDTKFLIFYNDVTDAEQFELAKTCPYFHCVFSPDEDE